MNEVEVGGRYLAKVSGILTTVRVLGVREVPPAWHGSSARWRTRIDVVNERTGRKLSFASAAKLRRAVAGGATGQPTAAGATAANVAHPDAAVEAKAGAD